MWASAAEELTPAPASTPALGDQGDGENYDDLWAYVAEELASDPAPAPAPAPAPTPASTPASTDKKRKPENNTTRFSVDSGTDEEDEDEEKQKAEFEELMREQAQSGDDQQRARALTYLGQKKYTPEEASSCAGGSAADAQGMLRVGEARQQAQAQLI